MYANDIKKGMHVKLVDGPVVTVADNKSGIIRDIEINGWQQSSYIHNWKRVLLNDEWVEIQYTKAQIKRIDIVRGLGF